MEEATPEDTVHRVRVPNFKRHVRDLKESNFTLVIENSQFNFISIASNHNIHYLKGREEGQTSVFL